MRKKTAAMLFAAAVCFFVSLTAFASQGASVEYNMGVALSWEYDVENPNPDVIFGEYELSEPSCEGLGFDGWYSDDSYSVRVDTVDCDGGDVTLYAKWYELTYGITYVIEQDGVQIDFGEALNFNPILRYASESVYLTDAVSPHDGMYFEGWYADALRTERVAAIEAYTCRDVTLYANWLPRSFSIRYDLGEAADYTVTNPNGDSYAYGEETALLPAVSSDEAYGFEGWYADEFFENEVLSIPADSTGSITLYAKWSVAEYPINYVLSQDGEAQIENPNPTSRRADESVTLAEPVGGDRSLRFDGWYLSPDFNERERVTVIEPGRGEVTLYAKWVDAVYSVTYNYGSINTLSCPVENNNPTEYSYGDSFALSPASADGFIFNGWCADALLSVPVTEIDAQTYGDLTLYADFTEKTYTISYVLENKGVTVQQVVNDNPSVRTTSESVSLDAPRTINTEYEFGGWYYDAEFTSEASLIRAYTAHNVTVYAKWVRIVSYLPVWGDATLSDGLSAADARLILRYSAGLETSFSEVQLRLSDLNNDSKVTAADARLALRLSAGMEKESVLVQRYSLPVIALEDGEVVFTDG